MFRRWSDPFVKVISRYSANKIRISLQTPCISVSWNHKTSIRGQLRVADVFSIQICIKVIRKENPKKIIESAYSDGSCNAFSVSTYRCFCHSLAYCTVMELMNKKSVLDDVFLLKSIASRPLSKISCSRSILLNKYRIYLVYIDLKN